MAYNKYKDEIPSKTIENIKNIYNDLQIEYRITTASKVSGIYSAVFKDLHANWCTCGKGTNDEFCIASAMGESIEHLCNRFAYDMTSISAEAEKHLNFTIYPDEKIYPVEKIKDLCPFVLEDLKDAYISSLSSIPDDTIFDFLRNFFKKDKFCFVPYYSVRYKKSVLLPEEILTNLCGSNGGGAGNTAAEAIGHGLDEITERYVKYEILKNRLTPPTIPQEYIKHISLDLFEVIKNIEKSGKYKVIVKDASLGKKLPVICVLLIDYKNNRYLSNFGSHPIIEIALERCLTEMFQYYELSAVDVGRKEMSKWCTVDDNIINSSKNWCSLLKDDVGYLPDSIFAGTPSWKFVEWDFYDNYCNKKGLDIQISNILRLTSDIFIRNNSFLGFPVYKIYVPKISCNHMPIGEKHLRCLDLCKTLYQKIGESKKLSVCDLNTYRDYVFNPEMFISSIVLHNMEESFLYALYAALSLDLGEQDEAKKVLSFLYDKKYECVKKALNLKENGTPIETINELLHLFYDDAAADFALLWCGKQVFLTLMNRYVINRYSASSVGKTSAETSLLHMHLKEKMASANIHQDDTNDIIR